VAPVQAQLVDEPAVHLQQLRVVRVLDQHVVKAQVQRVVALEVLRPRGGLHRIEQRTQAGELVGGDRERELATGHLIEGRADLVDVIGFVDRDLAHEDAAVLLDPHQPGFLERSERLADRAARDAEVGRDRDLVELFADRDLAGKDHPLELTLDQHGQRMALQQADAFGRDYDGLGTEHAAILTPMCLLSTIFFPSAAIWAATPVGAIPISLAK
jgi:hypothetical protein